MSDPFKKSYENKIVPAGTLAKMERMREALVNAEKDAASIDRFLNDMGMKVLDRCKCAKQISNTMRQELHAALEDYPMTDMIEAAEREELAKWCDKTADAEMEHRANCGMHIARQYDESAKTHRRIATALRQSAAAPSQEQRPYTPVGNKVYMTSGGSVGFGGAGTMDDTLDLGMVRVGTQSGPVGKVGTYEPAAPSPVVSDETETKGPYEARMVKGGVPTDCCDYGVVSLSAGVEVCRVWKERDARAIASALSVQPQGVTDAMVDRISQIIGDNVDAQEQIGGHYELEGVEEAAKQIAALTHSGRGVAEGKLVPEEPTPEMIKRFFAVYCGNQESARLAYRAMLAAAPEPEQR